MSGSLHKRFQPRSPLTYNGDDLCKARVDLKPASLSEGRRGLLPLYKRAPRRPKPARSECQPRWTDVHQFCHFWATRSTTLEQRRVTQPGQERSAYATAHGHLTILLRDSSRTRSLVPTGSTPPRRARFGFIRFRAQIRQIYAVAVLEVESDPWPREAPYFSDRPPTEPTRFPHHRVSSG